MPLINIEYDDSKINLQKIEELSIAVRDIVSKATGIEDVFVYANTSIVKIRVAPLEVFVNMSAKLIKNEESLIEEIKLNLKKWKKDTKFDYPINLTLVPMNWRVEVGI